MINDFSSSFYWGHVFPWLKGKGFSGLLFLWTSWKDWKSQSEIPSGGYSCQPALINKVIEIWIEFELKFHSGEPTGSKSIYRVGRFTEGSLRFSNFGQNKLASGFDCTGFCVLVYRKLSKCNAMPHKCQRFPRISRRSGSSRLEGD